ncbi:TetR/AcrR family transcriptional regulator [Hazenella sp. IB182357]|uniref:TetR/AcrR family transcriptional regulator n=1 Tax=Polycladospora coralii TaxID=2771432 RepID=A0A926N4U5_9BACL|nr:TetR/AcrR family transcriptional regulator [Polycladospora coralii]MBD1371059.1 TetR/AcrR family transcriptional regulator [Polycladospora coralii]
MNIQKSTKDNRKERILSAGYRLFGRFGYAHTSMKQIAKEADVAQGLISYYFENKEGLLVAIVRERMIGKGIPNTMRQLSEVSNKDELLAKAYTYIVSLRRKHPEWFTMLLSLWLESRLQPKLAIELDAIYREMQAGVQEVLEQCGFTGEEDELHTYAAIIQAMVDGLTIRSSLNDDELSMLQGEGWKGIQWLLSGRMLGK